MLYGPVRSFTVLYGAVRCCTVLQSGVHTPEYPGPYIWYNFPGDTNIEIFSNEESAFHFDLFNNFSMTVETWGIIFFEKRGIPMNLRGGGIVYRSKKINPNKEIKSNIKPNSRRLVLMNE